MLQQSTFKFLKELKKNNKKEWFDANREKYETTKADFASLIQIVIDGFCKTDATLSTIKAKDCLFRINRDIRFAKDKSPYKTNFAASINAGGKKSTKAGYYIHLEPGQNFVGGGIWQPMPDDLKKLRQEVDYNFKDFSNIINSKKFKSVYTKGLSDDAEMKLSRPPKGYDENNPAIEFIKLKSFVAMTSFTDEQLTDKKAASSIIKALEALHPLIVFLNHAME